MTKYVLKMSHAHSAQGQRLNGIEFATKEAFVAWLELDGEFAPEGADQVDFHENRLGEIHGGAARLKEVNRSFR